MQREIQGSFGNRFTYRKLLFAFICGSFARGDLSKTSDLDFFICTELEVDKTIKDNFRKWYFSIHSQFGLLPDEKYPGEIISVSTLDKALSELNRSRIHSSNVDNVTFDGLVWSGMLAGVKVGFVGNRKELNKRRKTAKLILHRWRLSIRVADDLFLKKFIKFSK